MCGCLLKFDNETLDLNVGTLSKIDALEKLTHLLEKKNYVTPDYLESIIKREEEYPTGLQFSEITVAIPHGDSSFVKQSSMAIGICRPPISFYDMGNIESEVNVNMIVLLAINDPTHHIGILNELFAIFQNEDLARRLKNAKSTKEILEVFRNNLGENNEQNG